MLIKDTDALKSALSDLPFFLEKLDNDVVVTVLVIYHHPFRGGF